MNNKSMEERAEIFFGKLYKIELDGETGGFKERIEEESRGEACVRFIVEEFAQLIEDCAKVVDNEAARLDMDAERYRAWGDFDAAGAYRAFTLIVEKLGRDIRALADSTQEKIKTCE